jgi:hypothetical protein
MSFSNWLNRIAPQNTSKPGTSRKAKLRRFRPILETLEDRCVPSFVVNSLADDGKDHELRSEIQQAEMLGQMTGQTYTVTFQQNLSGTITLMQGELDINTSVNVDATNAKNIVIDAHYASRVFGIVGTSSPVITVNLTDLTIERGLSDNKFTNAGGGMFIEFANVTLNNCTVTHNEALLTSGKVGSAGGALFVANSQIQANQCNITDNISIGGPAGAEGGGIYAFDSSVQLLGGALLRNKAGGGNGDASTGNFGPAAGGDASGGALFAFAGQVLLQGVEIDNNAAYGGAGSRGVHMYGQPGGNAYGGALYFSNCAGATIFACPSHQNKAEGGSGGAGSDGPYAGAEGGAGGNAQGGWLYATNTSVTLDKNVPLPPYIIQGNEAAGGLGGSGGAGVAQGGKGGDGGAAQGGATYCLNGFIRFPSLIAIPLNNQPWGLIDNTAVGGAGGSGGSGGSGGVAGTGGTGGDAQGGGVELENSESFVTGFMGRNTAQGGQGGSGGVNRNTSGSGGAGGAGGAGVGGALYSANKGFATIISDPFGISLNSANGGRGGDGGEGPNGGEGGNGGAGLGGAFDAANDIFQIGKSFLQNNNANGGAGGNGGGTTSDNGQGGMGGAGGMARGGAVNLDHVDNDIVQSTLSSNRATGGQGGYGGTAWLSDAGSGGNGGAGGISQGGAVATAGGFALLKNDVFDDNHALGGAGGIGVIGVGFSQVHDGGSGGNGGLGANGQGGSIFITGAATVNMGNSTISGSSAQGGDGGSGGPAFEIYFISPGIAGHGEMGGNGDGGGLFADGGTITLVNNTLSSNVAKGGQGGRGGDIPDTSGPDGGNGGDGGAGRGGGLAAAGANFLLVNNTFNQDSAQGGNGGAGGDSGSFDIGGTGGNGQGGEGGAIYASDGTLKFINDTIDGNTAASGDAGPGGQPTNNDGAKLPSYAGGIYVDIGGAVPDLQLMNTIVAQDQADIDPDIAGLIHSSDHDFIGDGTGAIFIPSPFDQIGPVKGNPIDPLLTGLGNYGGPTNTMIPKSGSLVNDKGNDDALKPIAVAQEVVLDPEVLKNPTDQRGLQRKVGLAIDIGATEYGVGPTTAQHGDPSNGAPFPRPKGNAAIVPPGIPHGGLHVPSEAFEASRFASSVFLDFLEDLLPMMRVPGRIMLDRPVPLSPQGAIFSTEPTFSWTAPPGATHYLLIVRDHTTGKKIFAGIVLANSWFPPQPFTPGHEYDWFVQARDDLGDFSSDSLDAKLRVERLFVGPKRAFRL